MISKFLTQNQWIPRAFNDWRFVLLVMIGSLAIFPDLGNATILALVALIMYTVSGIAHRWFIAFIGVLFGVSALSLTAIDMIGVDKFSKVPVFGYVAKRFSAYFNPFADLAGAGHQLANSYFAMVNGGWFWSRLRKFNRKTRLFTRGPYRFCIFNCH